FFFFFQAEDGIRDKLVTGVQTCALPILLLHVGLAMRWSLATGDLSIRVSETKLPAYQAYVKKYNGISTFVQNEGNAVKARPVLEIGRASCRERVEISVVGVALRKQEVGR